MAKRRRQMTAREVTQVLKAHGFELHTQKGSHQKWHNPRTKRTVIVPWHQGKALPLGTLRGIQKRSGTPESAWE